MSFLGDTVTLILGAILLYSFAVTLSDQEDSKIRLLFKSYKIPALFRKIMLPETFRGKEKKGRVNLAGIILHTLSTIPLLVVFPLYLILYFHNKDLALSIATTWGLIACIALVILIILTAIDVIISSIYHRFKRY